MIRCPNCGSTKLILYKEKGLISRTNITKDGKIPKRIKYEDSCYDAPEHVDCEKCDCHFNYEVDDNGKITKLIETKW